MTRDRTPHALRPPHVKPCTLQQGRDNSDIIIIVVVVGIGTK
jgi:hypothetical protein